MMPLKVSAFLNFVKSKWSADLSLIWQPS